jgi:hypothetical protein
LTETPPLRLFLDSNVLIRGIKLASGPDRHVLSLCGAGICKMVLSGIVREEVERNLLRMALGSAGHALLLEYDKLIELTLPEIAPTPTDEEILAGRHLIRHLNDVPVLLSALASNPDWLLTNNTEHFTETVSRKTGLAIATPSKFLASLLKAK